MLCCSLCRILIRWYLSDSNFEKNCNIHHSKIFTSFEWWRLEFYLQRRKILDFGLVCKGSLHLRTCRHFSVFAIVQANQQKASIFLINIKIIEKVTINRLDFLRWRMDGFRIRIRNTVIGTNWNRRNRSVSTGPLSWSDVHRGSKCRGGAWGWGNFYPIFFLGQNFVRCSQFRLRIFPFWPLRQLLQIQIILFSNLWFNFLF